MALIFRVAREIEPPAFSHCRHCVDHRVRIPEQQFTANEQYELASCVRTILAQPSLTPLVDRVNVELRTPGGRIPELPEIGAALVGGVVAPQKFATHFSIQSDQK